MIAIFSYSYVIELNGVYKKTIVPDTQAGLNTISWTEGVKKDIPLHRFTISCVTKIGELCPGILASVTLNSLPLNLHNAKASSIG